MKDLTELTLYSYRRIYVIITIGRSGSTHLAHLLRSTGVMGRPAEYYNMGGMYSKCMADWCVTDPRAYLVAMIENTQTPNGVAGVKVAPAAFDVMLQTRPSWYDLADVRYIYLQRRDIVRQAISLYRARSSENWHGQHDPGTDPPFNQEAIHHNLSGIRQLHGVVRTWAEKMGVDLLEMMYEDICSDETRQVRRIFDHVGIPWNNPTLSSPTKVMRDQRTEDWVRKLDALGIK